MAIIYTYPRLTNPDGTELIVVSETKNQNATRLLSVADICKFCSGPGVGGCSNSFLTVTTPASIIPATALGCDDNLVLTSGDGSVTISNVGNTINFTTAGGGGGGGCPPTYVIRPVICEEGICFVSEKPYDWHYTCDEALGALAPGYINNLTLNGVVTDDCWYIELATFSASATSCEICCTPSETVYKLSPCDGSINFYYTTETLTPGIAALVGMVSLITTPAGELCYTVSEESGDIPIAVVLGLIPEFGCESPECVVIPGENLLLTPCENNSAGYQVAIITNDTQSPTLVGVGAGHLISVVTTDPTELQACYNVSLTSDPIGVEVIVLDEEFPDSLGCDCCLWEFREYEECFTGTLWTFSTNDYPIIASNLPCIKIVPPGFDEPPLCLNFVQCIEYVAHPDPVLSLVDNMAYCCDDDDCPSTMRYEKCPDAPAAYEQYIYLSIPTGTTSVILATGDLDPLTPGDETWCYGLLDNVQGPVFAGTVIDYCPPVGHCICPATCELMEYYDCNDPGTLLYTTNMSIPPSGFIWAITEDSLCYKTNGPVPPNSSPINTVTVDQVWMDESEECGCCDAGLYPFVYIYNICTEYDPPPVGAPLSLTVDITGFPGYLSGAHPDVISVDVGIGYDVCYEFGTGVCSAPTHVMIDDYEDCPTCIASTTPVWDLLPCGGTPGIDNVYLSQGDLAPDPSGLNVGDIIDITGGTLSDGCYEIMDKASTYPASHTGTHDWTGPVIAGFYTDCECCEYDLRTYHLCDYGDPCMSGQASPLVIDMTGFGGTPPSAIRATEIATTNDCCYYLDPELPECVEITGIYVSIITGCEDPICATIAPIWEVLSCTGAVTKYVSELDLVPDPSGLNVGDIINTTSGTLSVIESCWEIISKDSAGALEVGTQDWNGPIAAGTAPPFYTACQCCELDLRLYDVCDTGTTCQGLVSPQLIIDMTAVPGPTPTTIVATDDASGLDCCYTLNGSLPPCEATTGVYVSTVVDCTDASCPS